MTTAGAGAVEEKQRGATRAPPQPLPSAGGHHASYAYKLYQMGSGVPYPQGAHTDGDHL